MIPRGVTKRYATALLNAAINANIGGEFKQEIEGLQVLFEKNPAFKQFLLSPQVLTKDKKDIIHAVLQDQASELLVRFLVLLIDKKRINLVDEIADAFIHLYEQHEGVLEAKVVTAIELNETLRQKLIHKLESETGKSVRVTPIVDPAIIGGMIIQMEDKIIDGSIRHELKQLGRDLNEIKV